MLKINIESDKRIETGPLQINNDWPGVFIRGDNAIYYSMLLEKIINKQDLDFIDLINIKNLKDLLFSCSV